MTYASWRKVLPNIYCEGSEALRSGKYRVPFGYLGQVACRSNAAYGRVMDILGPPLAVLPRVNVIFGFKAFNAVSHVLFTGYRLFTGSYTSPNACSNNVQASTGSHISATAESTYAEMPELSRL